MFNDFMNGLTEEQSTKHLSGLNVQKISNSFGLYIPISNVLKLIALNNEKYNRRTILHEFTHLLQDVIYVEQAETKDEYDETKLDHLNLTEADKKTLLNIMKDKDEIIPYFNEFCELTKDVYEAYYKNENINVFSEFIIDNLTTQTELDETLLNEYRTVGNGDLIQVYVFVCCYFYMKLSMKN